MNIGIYDLNECSNLNYKNRLEVYKKVGFKSVGLYIDDNYMRNNESYLDIVDYARKIGLKVNQVHVDYKISNAICDDSSNDYFEYVESKLKECIKLKIPYMVLHASMGENAPLISEIGLRKLRTLMENYNGVYLCFENVRDNRNLDKILKSGIKNVGMCYDLGHAYCYDDVEGLLEKCKENILCTHIHNNHKKDTHNTLFDGDIDCKKIVRELSEKEFIDNCLEVFPPRGEILDKDSFEEFVRKCYNDYYICKYQVDAFSYLSKNVQVKMDRPMGCTHPKHGFVYPVNYGYIPNTVSGDGEELDCYVLGEFKPLDTFEGKVIAIVHRLNDNDDKLVVTHKDKNYTDEQIRALTEFQERFFESVIIREKDE